MTDRLPHVREPSSGEPDVCVHCREEWVDLLTLHERDECSVRLRAALDSERGNNLAAPIDDIFTGEPSAYYAVGFEPGTDYDYVAANDSLVGWHDDARCWYGAPDDKKCGSEIVYWRTGHEIYDDYCWVRPYTEYSAPNDKDSDGSP